MASILSVGQSALSAAQAGLSTTGHNIANAATPGYSRQLVVQGAAMPQGFGFGFLGQGVEISTVKRVYSEFLGSQVRTAQTTKSALDSHFAQIRQIDNLLADPASGLSPALQGFFSGIQELSSNPSSIPSRQAVLSSAESIASRFQSLAGRLTELEQGVNSQVSASVNVINSYAKQISQLNDAIARAEGATGRPPNDLLDQRDQLIVDLNTEIRATVVRQSDSAYNVFIGNGQPLVVGGTASRLATIASPTNPEKIEVAYQTNAGPVIVSAASLAGGKLGGVLDFRSRSLEPAQNALGRVAIGLATRFNAQHQQGLDLNGDVGEAFFTIAPPQVRANAFNDSTSTAVVTASISDASALTASDYRLQFDGSDYTLSRLPGGSPVTVVDGGTVDGITLSLTGTPVAGDSFLIRPTVNGASSLRVAITDPRQIAAAALLPDPPVGTATSAANTGDVAISAATVDDSYTTPLPAPVSFTYDLANNELNVSPATAVTVTVGGVPTAYAAGTPVPYTDGATYSFDGISFVLSSPTNTAPDDGDSFSVAANPFGPGDNRNALRLGALQTASSLDGGTTTFQGAYSQLVSQIGNQTRELEVTSNAAGKLLTEAKLSLQNESGVNLDEEATNLMRYQQAYQAAGKVMQIAGQMFDVLLSLGR